MTYAAIEKAPNSSKRHVVIRLEADGAVDFGRWLQGEKHGDVDLGNELVKLGHELWESQI
jgi:hypothetical protein